MDIECVAELIYLIGGLCFVISSATQVYKAIVTKSTTDISLSAQIFLLIASIC